MTQEDKELLIVDLCARLPFMPKIKITYQQQGIKGTDEGRVSCDFIEKIVNDLRNGVITDMQIFLRPMSSMTEEEKSEFINYAGYEVEESVNGRHYEYYLKDFVGTKEEPIANVDAIDWLNAHHFDYRGLIPKGLAIEVTKENNPYKK